MKVKLISKTENAENVCALAATICTSPLEAAYLSANNTDEEACHRSRALVRKVLGMGHESIAEHANFTFGISGISRACSHQLVRHRIASFSQQSQRYVMLDGTMHVMPESIANGPESTKEFFRDAYFHAVEAYSRLIHEYNIPAEDARYLLPNAVSTTLVMTMNARELRHFFRLRCCERAQEEIRELAYHMLHICLKEAPSLFSKAGPLCVTGVCNEGSKSCGKLDLLKGNDE